MKKVSIWDWALILIFLIGSAARVYHLFVIPFDQPFRLGGLFYEFSRQIINNNFAFPKNIPYFSAEGIPYAYPPLGFYFQAFLIKIFSPPLFYTVNLIPPIISLFSLPAFYWMIRQYTDDIQIALVGFFAFAVIPPAFVNQIEAAGLAESFGVLAIIIYIGVVFRWIKGPNWKYTIFGGIILGLCVIASPGSAYAATLFSIVIFFWQLIKGIKKSNFRPTGLLIILGIIGLMISAPYWYSVMNNFGINFFVAPFLGQHKFNTAFGQIEQILSFQPAGQFLSFTWNGLILAGLIWTLLNHRFMIPVIFFLFWFIPREGIWLVAIPGAILAGIGTICVIKPLFIKAFQVKSGQRIPLTPGILIVILLILALANSIFAINVLINEPEWVITRDQVDVFTEFQSEIPEDSRVIILGNVAFAEWAPVLLEREVLNIEYGLEWEPVEFENAVAINTSLEEDDLTSLIDAIQDSINDDEVFLITSKTKPNIYENILVTNTHLTPLMTTPVADLYLFSIK